MNMKMPLLFSSISFHFRRAAIVGFRFFQLRQTEIGDRAQQLCSIAVATAGWSRWSRWRRWRSQRWCWWRRRRSVGDGVRIQTDVRRQRSARLNSFSGKLQRIDADRSLDIFCRTKRFSRDRGEKVRRYSVNRSDRGFALALWPKEKRFVTREEREKIYQTFTSTSRFLFFGHHSRQLFRLSFDRFHLRLIAFETHLSRSTDLFVRFFRFGR